MSVCTRWWMFNAVGVLGLGLQLVCLWLLKDRLHLPYVVAALLATELTILHNFVWHRRWTWADRTIPAALVRRLFWFNAGCATTAIVSVLLMVILVERLRVNYLVANLMSVAACSLANFLMSDLGVFRRAARKPIVAVTLLATIAIGTRSEAADLHATTAAAFDRYVRLTEARMNQEVRGKQPFLWIDQLSVAQHAAVYEELRHGRFVIRRLETMDGGSAIDVPKGICHHWVGTVLIPGVRLNRVVALMQDYDNYQGVYRPAVRRSKLLTRRGDRYTASLQLFMKRVLSVVLNTEYDVTYDGVAPNRVHVRSYATRIAEVDNPDGSSSTEKPVGRDSGFLWRFNNYCSLEERQEGTYVQCETISLSRGIPTGLGWIVGPFVTSIPRDSLEFTLGAMRDRLTARAPSTATPWRGSTGA